ncbi:AzlD domain-containing protein [Candidatus Gracilibacteria bacterium]|nr:AzlD domain-containing protein [Candidatus Gracilibacteria bacterium]
MIIWLTIIGMALVTLATRTLPLLALRGELPPWLSRWLSFVPVAVFTALVVPPLLIASDPSRMVVGPQLLAGLVGALVAWRTGNVLLTIAVGMATFWLLRMFGA